VVTRSLLQRRRALGAGCYNGNQLQRLREHLKEVQDSAFELVAALSFATVFVSGMFSVDAFTTVPEALWPRRSRYAGRGPPMGLEQVASRSPF
jgi:hypothetical protein